MNGCCWHVLPKEFSCNVMIDCKKKVFCIVFGNFFTFYSGFYIFFHKNNYLQCLVIWVVSMLDKLNAVECNFGL